jgi:hypothetical protein
MSFPVSKISELICLFVVFLPRLFFFTFSLLLKYSSLDGLSEHSQCLVGLGGDMG